LAASSCPACSAWVALSPLSGVAEVPVEGIMDQDEDEGQRPGLPYLPSPMQALAAPGASQMMFFICSVPSFGTHCITLGGPRQARHDAGVCELALIEDVLLL
jgi:hypothetical protein